MKNRFKQFVAMHSIATQIRRICAIAIVAIIVFSFTALSLTGCDTSNDTTHTHQWGAWKSNATQHWKECSCGEEYGRANHNGNPCPACEYNDSGHSHSYSDTWTKDATQHWKECSCGDKKDVANHSGNPCVCGHTSGGEIVEPTTAGLYRETANEYIKIDTVTPTDIPAVFTYVNANAEDGAYLLVVGEDLTVSNGRVLNENNARLTIIGLGAMRTISLNTSNKGRMFIIGERDSFVSDGKLEYVNRSISFIIGNNITLKGLLNNYDPVVYVQYGAHFIMQGNSKIIDNKCGGTEGGGVRINNAFFTMQDNASISGNKGSEGGGIYASGNIILKDNASISGNEATKGGGVYVRLGTLTGTFTMQDNALITDNETTQDGGGVYAEGITVILKDNAAINNNVSGSNGRGGGVSMYSGKLNMEGGVISGNKSISGQGGGVLVSSGEFTMSGNSIITNNETASSGGGVNSTGIFTMNGGVLSGNKSTGSGSSGGGGVNISGGTFTMNGGIISGNQASSSAAYGGGGGVRLSYNGTFKITNGIIYGGSEGNNSNSAGIGKGTALYADTGTTTQYGSGESWSNIPLISDSPSGDYRNTTINVINGILQ